MGSQPRRALCVFLTLLTLFLLGTVVVLTAAVTYFGVDSRDVITEAEMRLYERLADAAAAVPSTGGRQEVVTPVPESPPAPPPSSPGTGAGEDDDLWAAPPAELDDRAVDGPLLAKRTPAPLNWTAAGMPADDTPQPRIPKIVHQTWKTDVLPERWEKVRQGCQEIHHDYEYMLWSDASSREFIATHYPWFLQAFDGYPYPIQRADAIRYFVLHHYGGVYMDLDVGCRRSMDPLLYFEVILPATIPVGISNDVMFAAKGHPFMDLVIHNLVTFNHQYGTNYPTVMFSTGPMFLSAQYGLWPKDDDAVSSERQVRVLPRRWYGKNAPATEMGESFFTHFYGSSWHADDAGFITFLGKFGMALMYTGLAVVVLGAARLIWSKRGILKKSSPRPVGPIALPFHVPNELNRPGTPGGSRPSSPFAGRSATPTRGHRREDSGTAPPVHRGVLYYLPVWFMPPGHDRGSGPTSASPSTSWSSYIPGFEEEDAHRYQALPDFSRPPSPSNNSILHAPGATHDGAFDGVHLHSLQSSSSSTSAPYSRQPSSPTSPGPPAYATLKTWGTSLFRNASWTSHKAAVLPVVAPAHSPASPTAPSEHRRTPSRSGHIRTPSRPESPRPLARARSPLPPQYSASGQPAGAGSSSSVEPRPVAAMVRTGSGQGAASSSTSADGSESGDLLDGSEVEYESVDGRAIEDEVDRLLSEMAPDVQKAE